MLVAFGEFLQQHGLLERLRQVPIGQKTRAFAPQAKVIEFLAGIMSGIEHLQDLNAGPHPLMRDRCVAQAWGLEGFAHYSSVSRTLAWETTNRGRGRSGHHGLQPAVHRHDRA